MVRARSPFFWFSFLFALALGGGLFMLYSCSVEPSVAVERWIKNAETLSKFRQVAWFLVVFGGLPLTVIGVLEWRIWNGWEPVGLRQMYEAVRVADIYREPEDRKGFMRIEVDDPRGYRQWFILDPEEVNLCEVGDIVHLSAIGKHVSNIVVAEKDAIGFKISTSRFYRIGEKPVQFLYKIWMWLAPTVCGAILAKGFEHVAFREITVGSGRRYSRVQKLLIGDPAALRGWGFVAFGVVLVIYFAWRWAAGWEEPDGDQSDFRFSRWHDFFRF